jgi:hypothetical protein
MGGMEELKASMLAVQAYLSSNTGLLLGTLVLGGVLLLLLNLHKKKYSYYSAPSPPIRSPYWLFGNVEMSERYGRLWGTVSCACTALVIMHVSLLVTR